MSSPFRLYADDELGRDGYPPEWHRLPYDPDGGEDNPPDCPECGEQLYLGHDLECSMPSRPGIKHMVRSMADHRCVRCGHPYHRGKHSAGEWSPCDGRCTHRGPYRYRHGPTDPWFDQPEDEDWIGEAGLGELVGIEIEARYRILTVHHLDGVKANCRWWNLVALCQRCHLTIQGRVQMARVWPWEHTDWFKPYVAGYYAWSYLGEDLDRDQVDARLDELLALEQVA